jgi:hypothetical protein
VEGVAAAGGGALLGTAANQFVLFDAVRDGVGMNARVAVTIRTAIGPSALPTNIVNENGVSVRATVVFTVQVLRVFRARRTSSMHTPRRAAVSPPSTSDCERE